MTQEELKLRIPLTQPLLHDDITDVHHPARAWEMGAYKELCPRVSPHLATAAKRPLKENSGQGHKGGKFLEDEASSLPECPDGLLSRERVPASLYRKKASVQMLIPHPPTPIPCSTDIMGKSRRRKQTTRGSRHLS